MYPFIVADVGGTNARFALATGEAAGQIQIEKPLVLSGADCATFEDALNIYISTLEGIKPRAACVAIAGPVGEDLISMTNLPWRFSINETRRRFGFEKLIVMNDFAAQAVAASQLQDEDLLGIKPGTLNPRGNKAVFGPGTGLGVAGLVYNRGYGRGHEEQQDLWVPVASEGGHVNIAPATPLECEILRVAMNHWGHVSAENLISGPGLVNLYKLLAEVRGEHAQELQPRDVTAAALADSDALCRETLEVFCSLLGTLAGNLALTYGASGGVFMAGGILPRFADFLRQSAFSERFTSKGVMSKYVQDIPAFLVVRKNSAFLGAAAWLLQQP